ncbi:hypothetical protein F4778DRAFT_785936 [Xylariomycetidae sp. FL2044]|nr:hypothetical protein F4778DRAFT_785936 [Xylariomycetidae sp. FL2044]
MAGCTIFCQRLYHLRVGDHRRPSHEDLVQQLVVNDAELQEGWFLGTLGDLRGRSGCGFCSLAAAAISESEAAPGDPGGKGSRFFSFPARSRSVSPSYPSRFGTWLAFVAEDNSHVRGPDTARIVRVALRFTYRVSVKGLRRVPRATGHALWLAVVLRRVLPKTVNDAIDLAAAMGERYLWVDALCLVQDNDDDDTRAPRFLWPAPESEESVPQLIAKVSPVYTMAVLHSIDWHMARSVYSQRGWTLQEILDDDDYNISRVPDPAEAGFLPCLWAYQKLCENYSSRKLRSDADALRASAGVIRLLGGGHGHAADGRMRRRERFASFSWAGWEGPIMWPRENLYWYEGGRRTWDTSNIVK